MKWPCSYSILISYHYQHTISLNWTTNADRGILSPSTQPMRWLCWFSTVHWTLTPRDGHPKPLTGFSRFKIMAHQIKVPRVRTIFAVEGEGIQLRQTQILLLDSGQCMAFWIIFLNSPSWFANVQLDHEHCEISIQVHHPYEELSAPCRNWNACSIKRLYTVSMASSPLSLTIEHCLNGMPNFVT